MISARDFFINQAALTGEPYPVEKQGGVAPGGQVLNEAANYVFLGTSVVSGSARAIITKTGPATEFGRIAKTLVARPPETKFERGLKQFSYLMSKFVFFLVIFVFFINAMFRHGILDSCFFQGFLFFRVREVLLFFFCVGFWSLCNPNVLKPGSVTQDRVSLL